VWGRRSREGEETEVALEIISFFVFRSGSKGWAEGEGLVGGAGLVSGESEERSITKKGGTR